MALERWRRLSVAPLQSVVREIHGKRMHLGKAYYVLLTVVVPLSAPVAHSSAT